MAAEEPATKLQEQATGKGVYSYSYFAASCPTSTTPVEPRKLTDEEIAAQQEAERQRANGASAWNHAGTFEERDWTAWAKDRLDALLQQQTSSSAVQVTKATVEKGHANAWVVRGKKKVGFDLELTLSWATTSAGKEVKGTVRVPNAASDELDELEITGLEVTGGGHAGAGKQVLQALPDVVKLALEQLLEELKAK